MTIQGTDNITSLLTTFLDVQSRRTEVISGNIANADTPDYAARQLNFADFLKDAARDALSGNQGTGNDTGGPGGSLGSLQVEDQTPLAVGIDGNTVDVGHEMSQLSEAGMQYLAGAKMLQSRLKLLHLAIREGR